jgi:hypothetical protein
MANLITRIQQDLATDLEGETVLAATVAHPPGSMLYKQYAGSAGKASIVGGPIAEAISSKLQRPDESGDASRIPNKMGVLVLTDRRLLWLRTKASLRGPKPSELVAAWDRDAVTVEADPGSWKSYPSFLLTFGDGTSVVVFTDKKAAAREVAEAWA